MPNDRSIPDAAVWEVCEVVYCPGDKCLRCPQSAECDDRAKAETVITTVQRALAGRGEGETKGVGNGHQ
jgi:hypothetical protein